MTSPIQAKQLAGVCTSSEDRGEGAEEREREQTTRELDRTREELRAVNEYLASEKETTTTLTARICDLETELGGLREECRQREVDLSELQDRVDREKEAFIKDAELNHYRTLEEERAKWEAREQRAVDQLESMRRELLSVDKHDVGGAGVVYTTLCHKLESIEGQLQMATNELDSRKLEIERLQEERECTVLQVEELKAEVALLQAKLRRQDRLGDATSVSGAGTSVPSPSVGATTTGES